MIIVKLSFAFEEKPYQIPYRSQETEDIDKRKNDISIARSSFSHGLSLAQVICLSIRLLALESLFDTALPLQHLEEMGKILS